MDTELKHLTGFRKGDLNMERIYYTINEEMAKRAKRMVSFSDYKEGSKTAEYQGMCDKTYDLAEKAIEKRPAEAERIENLAQRYAKKLADNFNKDSEITCRCPSVMICGPANFPTRKKEKQVAAWDKNMEDFKQIQAIRDKIESIMYAQEVIKSGDENAIEKLEEKLDKLQKLQERMKEANKAVRLKDTEKGNAKLKEMGFTDEQIENLRQPDYCGRIGFADYQLKNNNANIRSTKARLENLKKAKEQGDTETECEFFKIEENTEDMRIRLIFDGKPDANVRDILKHNGFRWSPKNTAWQRQLNNNGRYAVKRVIEELKKAQ